MRKPEEIAILIVDDEEDLREAIVFDFRRKGFKVFEASNGRSAYDIVSQNPIDIVLSDLRMPDGDGVELLDRIKALNPTTPVVMFMTGFADLGLEDAYDKGAAAVFSKPFDRKELMATVLRVVSSKEEVWGLRKVERLESDFNVELHFSDFNLAVQSKVLNLGRGGIFVALKDRFPTVGARAIFKIQVDHGPITGIDGSGIVRWIRTQALDPVPAGCGIEIEHLNESSRMSVITLVNDLKTKSFIPKN